MLPLVLLLLLLGLFLLVAEAFIPGGIVGTLGVAAIIISGLLFVRDYGWDAGLIYFGISAVIGFGAWLYGFVFIARRLALTPHEPQSALHGGTNEIGLHGVVVKTLRPAGEIEIDGRRYAARSDLSNVELPPETKVIVTGVDSSYLVVEPAPTPSDNADPTAPEGHPSSS